MITETVAPRWRGQTVVVAAPGPSLTPDVAQRCKGWRTIAVQDAWRRLPWADVLYFCDAAWWRHHKGCPDFAGERWTTHDDGANNKVGIPEPYGLHCVAGKAAEGFSTDPSVIHYGKNSGFQAINLAILMGARRIVLVGFNMGRGHFFGHHPKPLRNVDCNKFVPQFVRAARMLPPGLEIVNATPGSNLRCFPMMSLDEALAGAVEVAA